MCTLLRRNRSHLFRRKFYFAVGGFLALLVFSHLPVCAQEPVDLETYGKQCSQGMTIYCLAAGMEEQKLGNLEKALAFYKAACENHSAQGHLRACTPYLSLANQLKRLDEAGAGLEALCKEGDDVICFYLAKEYFKITEYHRGFVHLERLCRENFQSPDELDYGPCYHLGKNLTRIGELKRAEKIFNFDCTRDSDSAKPSCEQAEAVKLMIREGELADEEKIKEFKTIEFAALGIVLVPLIGLVLWKSGRRVALKFLRIPVPVLTLFFWALWEPYARRELLLRADLFFIGPAVALTLFLAWFAHSGLQEVGADSRSLPPD